MARRAHRGSDKKGAALPRAPKRPAIDWERGFSSKAPSYHPNTNLMKSGERGSSDRISVTNLRAAACMKALQRADMREASKRNPKGTRYERAMLHSAKDARKGDDARGYAVQLDRDHVLSTDGIVRKGKALRKQGRLG